MADPGRGGAEKLRSTRRAPDGALWVGRGQGSPPENVERGGERSSSQLHRDENRGDRERARLENRRCAIAMLKLLSKETPAFFSDFELYQAEDRREAARIIYHKV